MSNCPLVLIFRLQEVLLPSLSLSRTLFPCRSPTSKWLSDKSCSAARLWLFSLQTVHSKARWSSSHSDLFQFKAGLSLAEHSSGAHGASRLLQLRENDLLEV